MVEQLFPDYEGKCLSKVPGTVAELLGEGVDRESLEKENEYEKVVLILLDGFGYKHWQQNKGDYEFLQNLERNGKTERLTSIYPSETAAAITTVNTGLTASQHALIGWNMYFEDFEASIKTLPFTTQDGEDPEKVYGEEFDRNILFEGESIYHLLEDQGVESNAIVPEQIVPAEEENPNSMFEGAEKIGYDTLADLSVKLKRSIEQSKGKNYFYIYIPLMDKVSHYEGTESEEYQAQLSQVCHALQNLFLDKLGEEGAEDTLLALTADHGFINIDPKENIDLLEHEIVEENLREKSDGEKVMPVGSPRNTHLYLKDGTTREVKECLEEELDALIWTREEAVENNLFGKECREDFGERIGDLIICGRSQAFWHSNEPEEIEIKGYHGGLSKQEMEIPLVTAEIKNLKQK